MVLMANNLDGCYFDMELEVEGDENILFYWAKIGQRETEGRHSGKIKSERIDYSFFFPFHPQKRLVRIDPVARKSDVKIKEIRFRHPMYETYEVDLKSLFAKKANYAHLIPRFLPDGGVILEAETDNPWFLVEVDLKPILSLWGIFFNVFSSLLVLLFFCLHPRAIKGSRKSGFLLVCTSPEIAGELFASDFRHVFVGLRLIKVIPSAEDMNLLYSFSRFKGTKGETELAERLHALKVKSYRFHFNRSGEV